MVEKECRVEAGTLIFWIPFLETALIVFLFQFIKDKVNYKYTLTQGYIATKMSAGLDLGYPHKR